ncbi:MAG TPA: ABC transporter ATP-binding protein [Candidatus Thermoplasmatota archaeon]|nr:ABC transporter ATP-binding protein [Candidatus Thermoplasmatota archaeon]
MAGDPYLRVEGLGKRYGDQWATRGVSFEVERGEIFGVLGPNGAGKTTTLKTLAGLLAPTEGQAVAGGLSTLDPRHKSRIGYLPEESPLYDDMTPVGYLRFFAKLYDVPRKVADERIEDALVALQLDVREDKKIGDMSKGMRRKVAIARSLVNDPEMVIYDEPASGLDPVVSAYILDLIRSLAKQGKTVIFSAHNLYHMERICDRVLILRKGSVVAQGTMREIRALVGGTEYVATSSVPLPGATPGEKGFDLVVPDLEAVKAVEARATAAGGRLVEVRTKELSLEEIFLRTTRAEAEAGAGARAASGSGAKTTLARKA